jgi:hypothetical protein
MTKVGVRGTVIFMTYSMAIGSEDKRTSFGGQLVQKSKEQFCDGLVSQIHNLWRGGCDHCSSIQDPGGIGVVHPYEARQVHRVVLSPAVSLVNLLQGTMPLGAVGGRIKRILGAMLSRDSMHSPGCMGLLGSSAGPKD